MADTQPLESHLNGGGGGGGAIGLTSETVGTKRQRRPSVRLGEIGGGDHLYETVHPRRTTTATTTTTTTSNKQWKHHNHLNSQFCLKEPNKASNKTRPLTNLTTTTSSGDLGTETTVDEDKEVNLDTVAIGSWRVNNNTNNNKDSKKRVASSSSNPLTTTATKRVRSNWVSKIDDNNNNNNNKFEGEERYSGGGGGGGGGEDIDEDDDYQEFDAENSESPLKEQSPIHSLENLGDGNERNNYERGMYFNRRGTRVRGDNDDNHHFNDGVEISGPSDTDGMDFRIGGGGSGEDGVRIWLNGLGLGRYAPVFEIHEVDDEVLPMLTLEDLKDMGINAVGSRRKMFCAIQKLGKGFS